jgi:gas vesicle protein
METKTFLEGLALGAVAGAIAGLLLTPKSGEETRDEIQTELHELKDQIVARLQTLEDFTQAKYDQTIKIVLAEYAAAHRLPAEQAEELETRLRAGYETVRQTIHEHTGARTQAATPGRKHTAKEAAR